MLFFPLFHQGQKRLCISACHKNRSCIGVADIHMTNTVPLLIFSGKLMFFYHSVQIIVHRAAACNTGLSFSPSCELINIIAGLLILNKDPFCLHCRKIFFCFFVYDAVIWIGSFRKVDLRPVHMEKRKRIFISCLTGLLLCYHIIWKRCHALCFFRCGAQRPECLKNCHNNCPPPSFLL